MVMFLMVLAMGMLGFAVCAALLNAAAPARGMEREPAQPADHPQFFVQPPAAAVPRPENDVPVDVLLAQLERHIRLEQAAAESFVQAPTAASLHGRTASPLMH